MAIEAKYGGRKCTGKFNEKRTCFHQNMSNLKDMIKKGEAKMKDSIYFCPGKHFTKLFENGYIVVNV